MERVKFGSDLMGFHGGPLGKPAVIVVQAWWGVNDEILGHAQRIIDNLGFQSFIPDLYRGEIGVTAEEANHLMSKLDFDTATTEIKQAVDYLKGQKEAPKVGVMGFCMGGALSFLAAEHVGVDAAAPFYGSPRPGQNYHLEAIKVPVQAHTGAEDTHAGFSDPATMQRVVDQITAGGGKAELFIYEGEGHGFMKQESEAMKLAWSRVEEFFKKTLTV